MQGGIGPGSGGSRHGDRVAPNGRRHHATRMAMDRGRDRGDSGGLDGAAGGGRRPRGDGGGIHGSPEHDRPGGRPDV